MIDEIELPVWSAMAGDAARPGAYVDCYAATAPGQHGIGDYASALYGSRLFAAERRVLAVAGYPSTSEDIQALAFERAKSFAIWSVRARDERQLWLADANGLTMSWLAVEPAEGGTRLLFGSLVLPIAGRVPWMAHVLMPVHTRYARALLRQAQKALTD
ncbi:MAG: hypothetical protein AAFY65_12915 [Pseudomonadota bacterium]